MTAKGDGDRLQARRVAFAAHVRSLRKAKGWSQETLAERSGLHRTYVSSLERGERNVSLDNLGVIADTLGISISDLFEGVE